MNLNINEGLKRGKAFFDSCFLLGKYLLICCGVITLFFFWVVVALSHQEFFSISVLMLKVLRTSVLIILIGISFSALLDGIFHLRYHNRLREMEKKINKNGKRNKNTKAQRTKRRLARH